MSVHVVHLELPYGIAPFESADAPGFRCSRRVLSYDRVVLGERDPTVPTNVLEPNVILDVLLKPLVVRLNRFSWGDSLPYRLGNHNAAKRAIKKERVPLRPHAARTGSRSLRWMMASHNRALAHQWNPPRGAAKR